VLGAFAGNINERSPLLDRLRDQILEGCADCSTDVLDRQPVDASQAAATGCQDGSPQSEWIEMNS